MAYTKTSWVAGQPPALSATNLLKLEQGVQDAHITADAALAAAGGSLPLSSNWVWALPENHAVYPQATLTAAETASDSKAGFDTFFAAVPDGGTAVIPAGYYRIQSQVSLPATKSLTVIANGAYFLIDHAGIGFKYTPTWSSHIAVTGFLEETDTSLSKAGESLWYSKLTLASSASSAWNVGDVVKLFSNDQLTFPNGTVRSGEAAAVASVSGTSTWLAGRMRLPFTTNIRAVKYPSAKLKWIGGMFERSSTYLDSTTDGASMIYLEGALNPEVHGVQVHRNGTAAFVVRKCYGALLVDCEVGYARNSSTPESNGYGVIDSGQATQVVRPAMHRVRHAYATGGGTDVASPSTDDNPLNYGAVIDARIIDGFCHGASQTGWDTHGDAYGVEFRNCVAVDCYVGFVLRGVYNRIIGGRVEGTSFAAVHVNGDASDVYYSYGHFIGGNLIVENCSDPGIYVQVKSSDPNGELVGGVEMRPTYVNGVTFINLDTGNRINANGTTVLAANVFDAGGVTTTSATNGGSISALTAVI